ncbi:hypothetical protein RDI58_025256 [Solanum bulbocastanum]|uniref:Uncharacterized protein n=1 Tax=Solanum bulbocastanum TaxID=147425 RepID=A0AAN8T6C7_SOLBU
MNLKFISSFLCFVLLHSSKTFGDHFTNQSDLETYIVHLEFPDQLFSTSKDLLCWHQSFLHTNSNHSSRILYSYRHVFNGFAATLSSYEVREMEKKPGFVSARPQRIFKLHMTTHTPSFLGLHQNVGLWNASNSGKGVIIGILDTGIAPQHPSFNDNGMPNPPLKWKGKSGHGTHTSSTATGNFVNGANFYGNANGTAVGIVPRAHVQRNDGPGSGTVENGSPWILTVGASTTDRKIRAVAVFGNGAEYECESAFQPTNFSRKLLPLVNGKYCDLLHSSDVKGKIVLCDTKRGLYREQIARIVKSAGGAGMILMNNKEGGSTTLAVLISFP